MGAALVCYLPPPRRAGYLASFQFSVLSTPLLVVDTIDFQALHVVLYTLDKLTISFLVIDCISPCRYDDLRTDDMILEVKKTKMFTAEVDSMLNAENGR